MAAFSSRVSASSAAACLSAQSLAPGQLAYLKPKAGAPGSAAHLRSASVIASLALRPSISALATAGGHTSSGMRALRTGVFPVAGLGTRWSSHIVLAYLHVPWRVLHIKVQFGLWKRQAPRSPPTRPAACVLAAAGF